MGNQPWPQFQNGIRERSIYQFREVVQGDQEPFLTMVNRLREIGKHCNFDDLDKK